MHSESLVFEYVSYLLVRRTFLRRCLPSKKTTLEIKKIFKMVTIRLALTVLDYARTVQDYARKIPKYLCTVYEHLTENQSKGEHDGGTQGNCLFRLCGCEAMYTRKETPNCCVCKKTGCNHYHKNGHVANICIHFSHLSVCGYLFS